MSWFSRCSWCGGPFNGGNCRHCTNVSFGDEPVYDSNPNSYNQTPDISNPHSQPLTSSFNQFHCFHCKDPLEDGVRCQRCTCVRCGHYLGDGFCSFCNSEAGNSFVNDSNPNSFNDPPNVFTHPLQPYATIITNPSELTRHIYHNHDIFYDGDDDEELLPDEIKRIQQILERTSFDAITPDFLITDSLSMGDKHLSTILETESDELIKSSVENLVPIPSESEDFSDIDSECDVTVCDDFTTISNPFFDADDDFSSSDDESFSDEDIPKEIYSNPLFDEEIISDKIDASIVSYPKFDSLLEEFSGELAHIVLIPPGINEADFEPEEEILLVEKLFYDNSSPRPPEEFNSKNSEIESLSPFPIPVEDSDSLMEEIDLFLTLDDSMPPGIENDDYDFEGDILFIEELLSNDSPPLPENESFHFNVPSSLRPPAKPLDDDEIKPDMGVFTKVVDDISDNSTRELYVHMPNVLPNLPTLSPMFDTLLPFSFENDNKVFNHGILASNKEKPPHLLSYRGFKAFQDISVFSKSPMMIYGEEIPILDVPIAPDYEASRAHGFVLRSLELQSFA
ncbi:hypothetical protein Tco_0915825 [Tanacetum coccineum]